MLLTYSDGAPAVRRNPTHRVRQRGLRICALEAGDHRASQRSLRIPELNHSPRTPQPDPHPGIPPDLQKRVHTDLRSWKDALSDEAIKSLTEAQGRSTRDSTMGARGRPTAHRRRTSSSPLKSAVRLGPQHLAPAAREIIGLGYTIDFPEGAGARIHEPEVPPPEAWGYNAKALREAALAKKWPDLELISSLQWGFSDYSSDTPPVCTFLPHLKSAYVLTDEFRAAAQEEIRNGWFSSPSSRPTTLPFHTSPGGLVPKSTAGKYRLIWNASAPSPDDPRGMVRMGSAEPAPICANANTTLPESFNFEWGSIERNSEALNVLASAAVASGAPLLGTTIDLEKWFRMHAVASNERWKTQTFFDGAYRTDRRLQMGRASSAHHGQRVTFLLVSLIQDRAISEPWGITAEAYEDQRTYSKLMEWRARRRVLFPDEPMQSSLAHVSSFQDDITFFAVGLPAARAVERAARETLDAFSVRTSSKPAANMPFAPTFTTIGARYDLRNAASPKCLPSEETLAKLDRYISEWKGSAGRPLPLQHVQEGVGVLAFVARFVTRGARFCNEAYASLQAEPHTARSTAVISHKAVADAERLLTLIRSGNCAPLISDPLAWYAGRQALACDASGSTECGGWGTCALGYLGSGLWPESTRRALADGALSISVLELLCCGILLQQAHAAGLLEGRRHIAIENDNASAVAAINSARARSRPMRRALTIVHDLQAAIGIHVTALHLRSEENSIADSLSRGLASNARRESKARFGHADRLAVPPQLATWLSAILER